MSPDRRYSDDEIAAIFREAAEAQKSAQHRSANAEGLTLAELQAIGKDAGITADFIADAAEAMDRTEVPLQPEKTLGQPTGVGRIVELPGTLSEDDWARLVVELRSTFRASGTVKRDGVLREWRNGNLKILLEPSESGHRLSMSTRKGSARGGLISGLIYVVVGLTMLIPVIFSSNTETSLNVMALVFAAVGAGLFGFNALTLPKWAEERQRQMEHIGAKAVALANAGSKAAQPADGLKAIETAARPIIKIDSDEEAALEEVAAGRARTR